MYDVFDTTFLLFRFVISEGGGGFVKNKNIWVNSDLLTISRWLSLIDTSEKGKIIATAEIPILRLES